ncbi:MAG: monovalent cation/H(+) antiporter subunit G [Acidobacteriaceae bacterium]
MSEAHRILIDVLLGLTACACWIGVLGMIRMRDPYQALHYLGLPALVGMGSLTIAVFARTGWSQASWKSAIILLILVAANSVGTHAAARAFRAREKGHWEPWPKDPEVEFLGPRPRA